MNRNFIHLRDCIRRLEHCPDSLPTFWPILKYDLPMLHSPYLHTESFSCENAARQEAQREFMPLYRQAKEVFDKHTAVNAPESYFSQLRALLDGKLSDVREALIPLRTEPSAPILNRMRILLVPDKVLNKLEEGNQLLLQAHSLAAYSHYLSYVQYAINDPSEGEEGLSWLLGKCFIRHGYDLFPAISELESDLSQQIRKFQQAFTVQSKHALHQHIIAPLQTLLPILHQSLSQSN